MRHFLVRIQHMVVGAAEPEVMGELKVLLRRDTEETDADATSAAKAEALAKVVSAGYAASDAKIFPLTKEKYETMYIILNNKPKNVVH